MLAPTYSSPEGVPSAMESLTAVFGMRTGVPSPLKHQLSTLNFIILWYLIWIPWSDPCNYASKEWQFGRASKIRTCDLRTPIAMRHQTAPWPDLGELCHPWQRNYSSATSPLSGVLYSELHGCPPRRFLWLLWITLRYSMHILIYVSFDTSDIW